MWRSAGTRREGWDDDAVAWFERLLEELEQVLFDRHVGRVVDQAALVARPLAPGSGLVDRAQRLGIESLVAPVDQRDAGPVREGPGGRSAPTDDHRFGRGPDRQRPARDLQ